MKRPAEALAAAIDRSIRLGWRAVYDGVPDERERTISLRTLQRWRKLAQSIDARMRLDGSKLNKKAKKRIEV